MITFHAGLHHTGSTSIQTALHVTKGNLDTRHIYLPWHEVFSTDAELRKEGPARLLRLVEQGWHPITSSEGMLGRVRDVYASSEQMAIRLLEAFQDRDFQVVVYVRPQHKWVASAFTHFRASGGTTSPEEYVASILDQPNLRYTNLVSVLTGTLGAHRVVVRPHTRFQDAVEDFFTTAGLGPVPDYVKGTWANCLSREGVSPLPLREQVLLRSLFDEDWPQLMDALRRVYGPLDPAFDRAFRIGSEWPTMPWTDPPHSSAETQPRAGAPRTRGLGQRVSYVAQHGPREIRYRIRKRALLGGL